METPEEVRDTKAVASRLAKYLIKREAECQEFDRELYLSKGLELLLVVDYKYATSQERHVMDQVFLTLYGQSLATMLLRS